MGFNFYKSYLVGNVVMLHTMAQDLQTYHEMCTSFLSGQVYIQSII